MTQLELATILNVSDRTVSKWEQLKGNPDIDILPALAAALCVSCDYLLTGKESNYRINTSQNLGEFINSRIKPHQLSRNDLIVLDSLMQQHSYDFLCDCFLIAHGQIVNKGVDLSNYVSTLMTQFERIVYAKSRPIIIQKMGELYYAYRNKKYDKYISKEAFIKRMYYYLNKADLKTDEEKISFIEKTLLPIIITSSDNTELKQNLKLLIKKESPFDPRHLPKEDPTIDDSALDCKIRLMQTLATEEFLSVLQQGKKIAAADKKIIDQIRKDYGLPDSVINVIIDYCLIKCDNIINRRYIEKVAASAVREGLSNAKEAVEYLRKVSSDKKEIKKR